MRRADARSAQICRPDGVARAFHVSAYSVEPLEAVLACNLFAKNDCRATLADEPMELRPEVSFVFLALPLPRCTEGLAGAGTCPDGAVVWPPRESEGVAPDADPGEEVALGEPSEIVGLNFGNGSVINFTLCNVTHQDQAAQPLGGIWIELVVVGGHQRAPALRAATIFSAV